MLVVSLLLAAPLLIQGDETVKDFRKFYRKEKDVLNKIELIYSLEGIEAPDVAKALLPILSDEEPQLAKAALKVAIQLESEEVPCCVNVYPAAGLILAWCPSDPSA